MSVRILIGDVRAMLASLRDESVHCCVTSPPYYGLRDYGIEPQVWLPSGAPNPEVAWPQCEKEHEWGEGGRSEQRLRNGLGSDTAKVAFAETLHPSTGVFCLRCNAWRGSLGLEPTPSLYIDHMVAVFREVRRVLRRDGTAWLNIGDSYATSGGMTRGGSDWSKWKGGQTFKDYERENKLSTGCKPKDLLGIPWALAFALRDDGWYLRSEIVWAKRAPMPESVTDRPTSAHEKVFLLSKSPKYFFDNEAVKEEGEGYGRSDWKEMQFKGGDLTRNHGGKADGGSGGGRATFEGKRNMRNWWLLGPEPFPEAHFATFVTEIPRRAILAGTSAKGVCPKCGAPWARVTEAERSATRPGNVIKADQSRNDNGRADRIVTETETIGWRPSCRCLPIFPGCGDPIPATVLDPFFGAGTTGLVADQLGRDCVGIELSDAYAQMAERRIRRDAGLFAQVAAE